MSKVNLIDKSLETAENINRYYTALLYKSELSFYLITLVCILALVSYVALYHFKPEKRENPIIYIITFSSILFFLKSFAQILIGYNYTQAICRSEKNPRLGIFAWCLKFIKCLNNLEYTSNWVLTWLASSITLIIILSSGLILFAYFSDMSDLKSWEMVILIAMSLLTLLLLVFGFKAAIIAPYFLNTLVNTGCSFGITFIIAILAQYEWFFKINHFLASQSILLGIVMVLFLEQ